MPICTTKPRPGDVNIIPSNPYPQGYGFNTDGNQSDVWRALPEIDITTFTGYLGASRQTNGEPAGVARA